MTETEKLAWRIYCTETAGSMDVRDFWSDLPEHVQKYYISSAIAVQFLSKQLANTIDQLTLQEVLKNVGAGRECRY